MIQRFEELHAWQKARVWVAEIYRMSNTGAFARDFGLRDQIRRAAVSVMSNLAEGFERGHRKEFLQFVMIAKGSCAEARAQLYAAFDAAYITAEELQHLQGMGQEVARLLGGLRKSLIKPRSKTA